ncbi:hypothetical protein [Geomonas anaerohicana]|uniref:Autotransporter domain-containing protein n=1 Tax=Geomonas anaerohicana TaxID=2798583 RepID=A0ABS0YI05_9BACT|nr:hypothetical protein [Geomonas anaerohicana]MBJ6751532.1 hypothetical protein [Geomonas anaerohicana]
MHLQHRLLGSLTTGLSASTARSDFSDGNNVIYTAGASVGYRKKLPESSILNVGYSYLKGLSEHNGEVSLIPVVNEQHPIPQDLLRHIPIGQPTFEPSTVVVTGAQSLLTYPPSYYRFTGDGIDLVNTYPADREVVISYSYRQDPNISTISTSQGLSASVDLFANRYRIYLDATKSDTSVQSGTATALTLTGTRHYDLGAVAKLQRHSLNAEAGYDKHFTSDATYLSCSWSYAAPYANGNLSLSVSDRWTQQSAGTGTSLWVNSLTAQTAYQRQFKKVLGNFTANYANVLLPGGAMSHSSSAGVNLEANFGKLAGILSSNVSFRMSDAGWAASENVGISVRRSF